MKKICGISGPNCTIFFGDATSCQINRHTPEFIPWSDQLRQNCGLAHLAFQQQVHGIEGWNINSTTQLAGPIDCFTHSGDFLITNQPRVGIGVLTADCLPLVFRASQYNVVAIAHAGWQGSVKNIAQVTLNALYANYGIAPADVQVYFGPAAQNCCYEVTAQFDANLRDCPYKKEVLLTRDGRLYFDNPKLNVLQLVACGVKPENINRAHHACTMCNHRFHSYRRAVDKKSYGTQATVVWVTA
jgi:YfiH family protein